MKTRAGMEARECTDERRAGDREAHRRRARPRQWDDDAAGICLWCRLRSQCACRAGDRGAERAKVADMVSKSLGGCHKTSAVDTQRKPGAAARD